jgi:threonine dehydrogenase-like Zn-dependent dehydrogenase
MRAAVLSGPGQLTVERVPDPRVEFPADAVVRVVAAGICGTDLRGYRGLPGPVRGPRCGHEFLGVVTDAGSAVTTARPGTMVVAPFMFSDGTCAQCRRGMPASCPEGGMWGVAGDGGQAEAVRVPFADATLLPVPMDENDERLPAVLALADVMATGHHAMHAVRPLPEHATVVVVGDGAVGLCSVLAARAAGAEPILLIGHHQARGEIGTRFGATEVVTARGAEAVEQVRRSTAGVGADLVAECVGDQVALDTATAICADGGVLSLVGGPHAVLDTGAVFRRGLTVTGGLAPARRYLPRLLDEVLAGRLDPGPVFDHTVSLAQVGEGYAAMNARQVTKVIVRP